MKSGKKWLIAGFMIVIFLGITVPGIVLHLYFSSKLNVPNKVNEEQYSAVGSAISKNASKKLTEYERMKLISGVWESTRNEVNASETSLSEVEAVELAREAVETLYASGAYPYHFESSYDNWYSWETHCYKCVENAFHTYSAYYFKVTFYRYDNNEFHEILITEKGTLLAIRNNLPWETIDALENSFSDNIQKYFTSIFQNTKSVTSLRLVDNPSMKKLYYYEDFEPPADKMSYSATLVINDASITGKEDLAHVDTSSLPEEVALYDVYTCNDSEHFLYCFLPWK